MGTKSNNLHTENPNEISIKELAMKTMDWWNYLRSKWIFILIFGTIGGAIGFYNAYSTKTLYNAELTFVLDEQSSSGGGLGGALGLASQFGFDIGGGGNGVFFGDNLLALIKSRSIVEKTLLKTIKINNQTQTLAEYFIKINNLREVWHKNDKLKNIQFLPGADRNNFSRQQDSILGGFYRSIVDKNLSVGKDDKKLTIMAVKVRSEDELFSKYFTEKLVKEVSDFYIETKTKKATLNLSILQNQTDSVRRALNSAILGVAASTDINVNPNQAKRVLVVPSQRRQVDVQANQAILIELVKNLEISKLSLRKETPLIQVVDRPILPLPILKSSKLIEMIQGGAIGMILVIMFLVLRRIVNNL